VAELTLTIEALSHGVFGVARTGDGVVLVPDVAPGDVVRARVVAEKKGYREAEVVEIVSPSPVRRTPPCRHLPECGGCTWQHVSYPAQLEAKEALLRDALVRIGGFEAGALDIRPIVPSAEWAYRHRVTLRVDGEQRLGFYRHRSHRLVEIEECLIADAAVNRALPLAREWLRGVSTAVRRLEIASTGGERVVFVANAEGPFRQDGEYHEKFLRGAPSVAGIVLFGKGWRRSFGKPRIDLAVAPDLAIATEGGFTQVNAEGNRRLIEIVLELADARADDRVLDLYCGAGNLTLPLARRVGSIVGVESDPRSAGDARQNADRAGLTNCRFLVQAAGTATKALAAEGERFSLVILDPPRSGSADVVDGFVELEPSRIVYVSCNPATLARDLRRLVDTGFSLGRIQPIDLFPQTYHLEVVARLDRRGLIF
jgi:23S rRNA (uracil1939-C5)-methyltransferase